MENKTLEQIRQEFLTDIQNKLETRKIINDYALTWFCAYAGRLASLGIEKYLHKAEEMFVLPTFVGRVDSIFQTRIQQGIEEISQYEGEELGISIGIVQDFYCFFSRTSFSFSPETTADLNYWVELTEHASLDEEAVDTVEDYLECFPIAEEDQLAIVAAPLSEQSRAVLENIYLSDSGKEIPAQWNPSERYWVIPSRFGNVYLSRLKRDSNTCQYRVIDEDGHRAPVFQIRQGKLPVFQSKNPTIWIADYSLSQTPQELEAEPLVLRLAGGSTSTFCYQKADIQAKLSLSDFVDKKYSLENAVMAAAEESEERIEKFHWTSAHGSVLVTGWLCSDRLELTWNGIQPTKLRIGTSSWTVENTSILELKKEVLDQVLERVKGELLNISVLLKGQDNYLVLNYVEK